MRGPLRGTRMPTSKAPKLALIPRKHPRKYTNQKKACGVRERRARREEEERREERQERASITNNISEPSGGENDEAHQEEHSTIHNT